MPAGPQAADIPFSWGKFSPHLPLEHFCTSHSILKGQCLEVQWHGIIWKGKCSPTSPWCCRKVPGSHTKNYAALSLLFRSTLHHHHPHVIKSNLELTDSPQLSPVVPENGWICESCERQAIFWFARWTDQNKMLMHSRQVPSNKTVLCKKLSQTVQVIWHV